jgi:hypothetical protein
MPNRIKDLSVKVNPVPTYRAARQPDTEEGVSKLDDGRVQSFWRDQQQQKRNSLFGMNFTAVRPWREGFNKFLLFRKLQRSAWKAFSSCT